MAIASIARLALTAVHGISKVSKVVTAGIFIALMASISAGIARSADLKERMIRNQADSRNFNSLSEHLPFHCPAIDNAYLFFSNSLLNTFPIRLGS